MWENNIDPIISKLVTDAQRVRIYSLILNQEASTIKRVRGLTLLPEKEKTHQSGQP